MTAKGNLAAVAAVTRRTARNIAPARLRNRMARAPQWAVGVLSGATPYALAPDATTVNPILTYRDVSDVPAAFVADPFAIQRDGNWYVYFEVMNQASGKGEIGLATSPDLSTWSYQGIVLAEPFHLSYPYVFEWDDTTYMVPEAGESGQVRLYRASQFPDSWMLTSILLEDPHLDPSLFWHGGSWWMLSEMSPRQTHDRLLLHGAPHIEGPWRKHPASPLISGDATAARPAGRVIPYGDRLVRYAQDCAQRYGLRAHAFEICELTPTTYQEQRIPGAVVSPGKSAWNSKGMHHVDAHELDDGWVAFVDGH